MYYKKIESILKDIEDKNIEIAGGSVIGIVLSSTNALIKYIANLTINKKKYEAVKEKIIEILNKAETLKNQSLNIIDKDKKVLEEILAKYKTRAQNDYEYQQVCKESTDFCINVAKLAIDTLKLADNISKVGNKMLESDFKICKFYAFASVQSALENVYINVKNVNDEFYKNKVINESKNLLNEAKRIIS